MFFRRKKPEKVIKASEYVVARKSLEALEPPEFRMYDKLLATVDFDGDLSLRSGFIKSCDALALAEWIKEVFGEEVPRE